MSVGISTVISHGLINVLRGTDFTAITPFAKLHTGDPGSAGTSNASAETTRKAVTFGAPASGSSAGTAVSWAWTAANETVSHVSYWTASTGGSFLGSGALSASQPMTSGNTLQVTPTMTVGTLAA